MPNSETFLTSSQTTRPPADPGHRRAAVDREPGCAATEETIIEPQSGWPSLGFEDLWKYRDLVFYLTLRNVKVRYKQTILGVLWAVLQPVLWMAVFAVALGRWVAGSTGDLPYPIFVFSGLLPWVFFQTAVSSAANSVVSAEGLVTKVYFPRLAIPLSSVAAALIDLAISLLVLLLLMPVYGVAPSPKIVLLPLAVFLLFVAAMGVGTLIAALTVSYRDFRHAVAFGLQIWMLATTVIYVPSSGPGGGLVSHLNPLTAPIEFFRGATVGSPIPWNSVAASAGIHAALCFIGLAYFRRAEDSFADVI